MFWTPITVIGEKFRMLFDIFSWK